jgi:hypothetical protein
LCWKKVKAGASEEATKKRSVSFSACCRRKSIAPACSINNQINIKGDENKRVPNANFKLSGIPFYLVFITQLTLNQLPPYSINDNFPVAQNDLSDAHLILCAAYLFF